MQNFVEIVLGKVSAIVKITTDPGAPTPLATRTLTEEEFYLVKKNFTIEFDDDPTHANCYTIRVIYATGRVDDKGVWEQKGKGCSDSGKRLCVSSGWVRRFGFDFQNLFRAQKWKKIEFVNSRGSDIGWGKGRISLIPGVPLPVFLFP